MRGSRHCHACNPRSASTAARHLAATHAADGADELLGVAAVALRHALGAAAACGRREEAEAQSGASVSSACTPQCGSLNGTPLQAARRRDRQPAAATTEPAAAHQRRPRPPAWPPRRASARSWTRWSCSEHECRGGASVAAGSAWGCCVCAAAVCVRRARCARRSSKGTTAATVAVRAGGGRSRECVRAHAHSSPLRHAGGSRMRARRHCARAARPLRASTRAAGGAPLRGALRGAARCRRTNPLAIFRVRWCACRGCVRLGRRMSARGPRSNGAAVSAVRARGVANGDHPDELVNHNPAHSPANTIPVLK
jgi:hypothetical protein